MALVKQQRDGTRLPSLLSNLFDADRFFEPFSFGDSLMPGKIPAVNVSEDDKEYRIEMAVPGMAKEDLKINIEDNILSVSAEKKEEKVDSRYTRREYSYNSFSRSFQLPENIKPEEIKAAYKEGVLTLNIPRKEEQPVNHNRRQISIS